MDAGAREAAGQGARGLRPALTIRLKETADAERAAIQEDLMSRLRLLITVNSLVGIVFGAVLLAAPGVLMQMYGLTGGVSADLFARLFGAELLGFNLATWFVRGRTEGEGAALSVLGHCVAETFGFAVSLGAALAHVGNAMIWSVVALFAFFAGANWYFYMVRGVRLR